MRLEKDSYYIKHWITPNGEESAMADHYIEVWSDGFYVDTYGFSPNRIDFEDASYNGVNPDDKNKGKRILKRYYDRWEKRVMDCKTEIERIATNNSSPYEKAWSVGDYLYFPLKEIYAQLEAEELEEEGLLEDDLDEGTYEGPELCLAHITKAGPEKPEGTMVCLDKYCIEVVSKPKPIPYLDFTGQALSISKDVYERAENIIYEVSSVIMEEIKQKCKK